MSSFIARAFTVQHVSALFAACCMDDFDFTDRKLSRQNGSYSSGMVCIGSGGGRLAGSRIPHPVRSSLCLNLMPHAKLAGDSLRRVL